jgi:hypothetical protein
MKLGKLKSKKAVTFKFSDYVLTQELPKPPSTFGHERLVANWQMLGNDSYGDCVWAGAAHETMMWNKEAGKDVSFTDKAVLSDYSAVTGFNPHVPSSDNGTDMQQAASYRRKTGVVDSLGKRHTIAAYLALTPGDLVQHYQALWLFGAVGIGIEFPSTAMDQFNKNKPWSVVRGASIEGGHYIPLVAKRKQIECVTWGKVQPLSTAFFRKYNDESLAYVSLECLVNNKSPEGFDAQALLDDLAKLKK